MRAAGAQEALDVKSAARIRKEYVDDMDSTHVKFIALAKAIPADKYAWRPGAGVRSVSVVLMHIVGEWYFYGPRSVGGKEPADLECQRSFPRSRRSPERSGTRRARNRGPIARHR